MPNNATANQYAADFGTIRSTLMEQGEQSLSLQGEQINIEDESRRAINAIQAQMDQERMVHEYKLADMQYRDLMRQARDATIMNAMDLGFGALNMYISNQRQKRQMRELKEAYGLIPETREFPEWDMIEPKIQPPALREKYGSGLGLNTTNVVGNQSFRNLLLRGY